MRFLLPALLLALTGYYQLGCKIPADPEATKVRIMELVEAQRQRKDGMKDDQCPADAAPEMVDSPKRTAKDCAADPSQCLDRCDAGDGHSCYALANLIQEHDTIENDVAQILYRRSCRAGVVSGCTNAAASLFELKDETSIACAARTFDIACEKNDPWACTMNGFALAEGIGRTKNLDEANRSFDKACEVALDKSGEACARAKELKAILARNN